jgi:hypothetical protein
MIGSCALFAGKWSGKKGVLFVFSGFVAGCRRGFGLDSPLWCRLVNGVLLL